MRNLKILILINSLGGGGAERVTLNLAREWRDAGADVVIATLQSERHDAYLVPGGIRRVSLNISGKSKSILSISLNNIAPIIAIRKLLRREQPDIAIGSITIAAICLALARTGDEISIGYEHSYPSRDFSGWTRWIWNIVRRYSYTRLDGVVALTPQSVEWLRENTHARKVVAIPNWISLPLPDNKPRIEPKDVVPAGKKLLLAAGRLHKAKRFDILLDAFAQMTPRYPDWHLVILGEGDLRKELGAQMLRLGLTQQVHLPSFAGNMTDWYRAADAFVLTSDYEGFGMVLIEAMAHGCAVISTDCEVGPGVIIRNDEDGLLVPQNDLDALVAGLNRMLSDDALRTLLSSKAVGVLETYSPTRVSALWQDFFDALLEKRNVHTK